MFTHWRYKEGLRETGRQNSCCLLPDGVGLARFNNASVGLSYLEMSEKLKWTDRKFQFGFPV
ncbi:MAG TPA: hypothetical protein VMS31_21935, partial [Pyrinomonadaceae bacterium]|nr:hypothetical protein [Pyrinomonadaceae bacterium]